MHFLNYGLSILLYLNVSDTLKHLLDTCKFYLNCRYLQYSENYLQLLKIMMKNLRCQL